MAARISPGNVGVFLCAPQGKSDLPEAAEEIARFLETWYPAVKIRLAWLAFHDPDTLTDFIYAHALRALVLVPDGDPASQSLLQDFAEAAGLPPWAIHLVITDGETPASTSRAKSIERAKALCAAAVERALSFEEIPPEHLKPTYPSLDSSLSRRALLRSLARVRYQVVPRVNVPRCRHSQGCSLCLKVCPRGAIAFQAEAVAIDKVACDGCGICVKACPAGAIHYPTFGPDQMDAAMRGLLHPEIRLATRIIALTCKEGEVPAVPGLLPLLLPCVGMVSPFMLLRAFDLGADGVALIQGGKACGRRHELAHLAREVRTSQAALEVFGIEKERIAALPGGDGFEAMLPDLEAFCQGNQKLGPTPLAAYRPVEPDQHQWQLGPLLAGIARKLRAITPANRELPLGLVEVDAGRCTLCSLCALPCPTEALRFTSDGGQAVLRFNHATCVACGLCVRACPEKALALRRALDFGRIGSAVVLLREEMARCGRCGLAFAPLKMCQKIREVLAKSGVPHPEYVVELCPACRVGRIPPPRPPTGPEDTCLARLVHACREQ